MTLDKSINDDDNIIDETDFKIVISKSFDGYYKNLQIEWVDGRWGKGFNVFDAANPGCS